MISNFDTDIHQRAPPCAYSISIIITAERQATATPLQTLQCMGPLICGFKCVYLKIYFQCQTQAWFSLL